MREAPRAFAQALERVESYRGHHLYSGRRERVWRLLGLDFEMFRGTFLYVRNDLVRFKHKDDFGSGIMSCGEFQPGRNRIQSVRPTAGNGLLFPVPMSELRIQI